MMPGLSQGPELACKGINDVALGKEILSRVPGFCVSAEVRQVLVGTVLLNHPPDFREKLLD